MVEKLPVRKIVREVLSSRYEPGRRPLSWDDRREGVECVRTTDGELILLQSSGQQSSPAPFWEILLMDQTSVASTSVPKVKGEEQPAPIAYSWTLYGIGKGAPLTGIYAAEGINTSN